MRLNSLLVYDLGDHPVTRGSLSLSPLLPRRPLFLPVRLKIAPAGFGLLWRPSAPVWPKQPEIIASYLEDLLQF